MNALRIGVNALYLIPGGVGGTEIYLRNVLAALASLKSPHQFVIITNEETGQDLVPAGFVQRATGVAARNRIARILYEQIRLPDLARRERFDVLWNPGFTAPFGTPCPQVTVFHDLQHVRHPEFFRWWDLPFWRFFLAGAVRRSEALIAVSEATRQDLLAHYKLAPERVTTAPHGVEDRFRRLIRRPEAGHLLCVSTLHPHKNLARLIRVFSRLELSGTRLTIAGMRGHHAEQLESLVRSLRVEDRVQMTGWVPRDDLLDLYSRADAFVFPSTFEGFGMPVLEALAAGIPTACSSNEPMRSIAGEGAVQFDPGSDDSLQAALQRILTDESTRQRLSREGPIQAKPYTWERTARITQAVLEQAAQAHRGA